MLSPRDQIRKNLEHVRQNIARACCIANRSEESVQLVVVSKGHLADIIQTAIELGVTAFGENYPEEAIQKMDQLGCAGVTWHMIGHLQSRKVGLVVDRFHVFQALDSVRIAEKLDQKLIGAKRTLPVLLEINIAHELNKYGWSVDSAGGWEQLCGEIEKISGFKRLVIRGLMTMPPYQNDPEMNRVYFRQLAELRGKLSKNFPQIDFSELSMGTSGDYEVAVQEGATFVRIGTAILGERLKKPTGL